LSLKNNQLIHIIAIQTASATTQYRQIIEDIVTKNIRKYTLYTRAK